VELKRGDAHREGTMQVGPNGEKTFWLWVLLPANTVLADTGDFGVDPRGAIMLQSIEPTMSGECCGKKTWSDVPVVRSGPRGHANIQGGFRRVTDQTCQDVQGSDKRRWINLARINVTFDPIGEKGYLRLEFKEFPRLRDRGRRIYPVGSEGSGVKYILAIGGHTTLNRLADRLGADLAQRNGTSGDPEIQVTKGTTVPVN